MIHPDCITSEVEGLGDSCITSEVEGLVPDSGTPLLQKLSPG